MTNYAARYTKLNDEQRRAVDTIDGPLLVIAGPGTGKTELLSMRAASILQKTDTLANSILCLTFTDSGAAAMRERLSRIIGPEAYKVAIHTFHSFGAEIINRYSESFYRGASMQPADELAQYEIVRQIFADLDQRNPLAGMNGDEYTYLRDTVRAISEIKTAGLASEELRQILDANQLVFDAVSPSLAEVFSATISKKTITDLAPLARKAATISQPQLPPNITPYANTLSLALAHVIDEATTTNSTKPITAWKNAWCEKDVSGQTTVLKDAKRQAKLYALIDIYERYLRDMRDHQLYDFDDMILEVVHGLATNAELRANLQETYQYVMVDEFQDTNKAQLRILLTLMNTADSNVMAVGDDDQAIFSFQGAEASNFHRFRDYYNDPPVVTLVDNYRSASQVLEAAAAVIHQADDRLEATIDGLSKQLTAHATPKHPLVTLNEYANADDEMASLAAQIAALIKKGTQPSDIAVLARRHFELEALLPHLTQQAIAVNYERRENVLDHTIIRLLSHGLTIIDAMHRNQLDEANGLLPELISHPAFGFSAEALWALSLAAWKNHELWLDAMKADPIFQPLRQWLLELVQASRHQSLEQTIDNFLGVPSLEDDGYRSPLYDYFFGASAQTQQPDDYIATLEALRTIRDRLREHYGHSTPTIETFLSFIRMHHELGSGITAVRRRSDHLDNHINLMTAHKSKGLEYEHVFVIGATDGMWGERARSKSRLLSWPQNLHLEPAGASSSERIRLFYVAMTRAKATLQLSYNRTGTNGKVNLPASFLSETSVMKPVIHDQPVATDTLTDREQLAWNHRLAQPVTNTLQQLLAPTLERYKLSATHLNTFLDVTRGGPQNFLLHNLLRFPQAKSAQASYGTAIHATLQRTHLDFARTGQRKPTEDIVGLFESFLNDQHLNEADHEAFRQRGVDSLNAFLEANYQTFTTDQLTERSFGDQAVQLGEARLTGALDLVDIDREARTITVTDYKTGKPSRDWKGKSEYEKIKLHKYRQQLMFYQLLVENSRDYHDYSFTGGILQFVEPEQSTGDILQLSASFSDQDLADFSKLLQAVWQCITRLDLLDVTSYDSSLKGILAFEQSLIDNTAIK